MHAIHPHPRPTLAAMFALLAVALLAVLIPAQLGDADFGFGGAQAAPASQLSRPAPATTMAAPSWVARPLAPPLDAFGTTH